jgi:hypothetical protein
MSSISTGRQHLRQAQRERLLKEYQHSRLSQREFVARAGLGLSTLQRWLRKAAAPARSVPPAGFVEVRNPLGPAPGAAAYCLRLGGGIDLEVASGFRPEELASLVRVLRDL